MVGFLANSGIPPLAFRNPTTPFRNPTTSFRNPTTYKSIARNPTTCSGIPPPQESHHFDFRNPTTSSGIPPLQIPGIPPQW